MTKQHRITLALLSVGVAIALAGCANAPHAPLPASPWAAEIAAAKSRATTDFERAVFADGVISREEYAEAAQRYVDCMKQHGYRTTAVDDLNSGVFQFRTTQEIGEPDIDDGISDGCSAGTRDLIEPLYVAMLRNPNRQDSDELVLNCLKRKGAAPAGMTVSEFKKLTSDQNAKKPWNEDDSRVALCWENPSIG